MAIDPKKKAQVVLDLAGGMSIRDAAKRHKVATGTVSKWSKEMQDESGVMLAEAKIEAKATAFERAVEKFGVATMDMLKAQADLLADPSYLSKQKTGDIVVHTKFVADYLSGFMRLQASLAGKKSDSEAGIVRAEIVDE